MPFITTPERVGERRAALKAVATALRSRFGDEGLALLPEIKALYDADKYLALLEVILRAASLEEVRRACAEAAAPAP
jgi:hypothetical protein